MQKPPLKPQAPVTPKKKPAPKPPPRRSTPYTQPGIDIYPSKQMVRVHTNDITTLVSLSTPPAAEVTVTPVLSHISVCAAKMTTTLTAANYEGVPMLITGLVPGQSKLTCRTSSSDPEYMGLSLAMTVIVPGADL